MDARIEQLERELAALRQRLAALEPDASQLSPLQPSAASQAEVLQRVLMDRVVLEHLPDFVCVLDRSRKVLYLNRAVRDRGLQEIVGVCATDYMPEDQRARFNETFEYAWSHATICCLEFESLSGYSFSSRFIPVEQDGRVELMLVTSLDTTERVRTERALRQSERRLRHAIDVAGMGTWTYDRVRDQLQWDEALCIVCGVPNVPRVRSYADFVALVHPQDRDRIDRSFRRSWETGDYEELEYRMLRPSGEVRYVVAKGSAIRNADGEVMGSLGAVFDVTTRKRLEEQVYQAQKMEAVGQLTAGIAHNFNNVLSIILPNVALCKRDATQRTVERLSDIEHAAQRAADLVRQLMLFARREVDTNKSVLDPVVTVQRTVEICRTTFDRAIAFELTIGDQIPAVLAHGGQLEQVLLNICINARDAFEGWRSASPANSPEAAPAPQISITIERSEDGSVGIRVSDNGPGMDESTRARVFEPFFTTKEVGRGTGLGLASAYAIVQDHGGRIECESRPGTGTRFRIQLPGLVRRPSRTPSLASGLSPRPGSETVFIVDDEPLVRRATRSMLEHGGYRVIESGDGAEALAMYAEKRATVDLLILDRSMPGMSGEQVFMRLRELGCDTPVVLLSGQPAQSATAEHAAAVLSKPVELSVLLNTVRAVLDRALVKPDDLRHAPRHEP